jgi:hypothetical protein
MFDSSELIAFAVVTFLFCHLCPSGPQSEEKVDDLVCINFFAGE